MTFTEKLDSLMKENGLNKNSLSKACGIPYTTIDGWYKKGCSDLKVSSLKKLTNYFDLSLDYWLDDEYEETKKSPVPAGTEDEFKVQEVVSGLTDILDRLGMLDASGDISAEDARVLAAFASGLCFYFRSRSDES